MSCRRYIAVILLCLATATLSLGFLFLARSRSARIGGLPLICVGSTLVAVGVYLLKKTGESPVQPISEEHKPTTNQLPSCPPANTRLAWLQDTTPHYPMASSFQQSAYNPHAMIGSPPPAYDEISIRANPV